MASVIERRGRAGGSVIAQFLADDLGGDVGSFIVMMSAHKEVWGPVR